eukprot:s942_g8.t1
MSFGSKHTSKAQQIIPDARHDPQLLRDTVLSIKASFRSLENSGNFLEHKVSRSRTRILGQLLAARHAALEETPLKPVLPTMPWSTPRMDSRPTAVVYAKARADQEAQRVESRPLKVTLQEVDSDAESDCSDSSSDISKLDLEARAAELAEPDWPGRSDRRRNSGTAGDDESQSENSQDLLLEEEESPAIARSARGSIASSIAAGVSVKASSVGRRPSTAGNAPSFRRGSFAKARESRPRPTTKMQLRVQTNRPFSAPRMRCDVGSDAQRPGTAPAVRRTSTPRTPATPRQKVGRPGFGRLSWGGDSASGMFELEERDEEDLLDFISEGDGEDIDTLEEPLRLDESFPSTLIVSGIPQVPKEKFDKLLGVISKLFNKYGDNEKEMPFNAAGTMTEGCVLITYESADAATQAQQARCMLASSLLCKALDGMSLDKKHTFKVVKLDQFNEITNRDEDMPARSTHTPSLEALNGKISPRRTLASYSRNDFRTWLTDTKCREQFLLRYQTETEIYWHDTTIGEPTLSYGGEREKRTGKIWCDWQVQWSPLGHFLTTFHKQGVALWGGPEFTKKIRFAHDGVKYLEFSPTEEPKEMTKVSADFLRTVSTDYGHVDEYALTWNGTSALENDTQAVRIHRVLTGESVFNCRTPAVAPLGGDFPHFLWSHDGKYFAECNEASISVRETDTFQLIKDEDGKKRTLKFPELSTFQWSPKDPCAAL